jgi:hypothetical protein
MSLEQAHQTLDESLREYITVCERIKAMQRLTPGFYDLWVTARLHVWMAHERLARAKEAMGSQ